LGSILGLIALLYSLCSYFFDYAWSWLCRVLIADLSVSSQVIEEKQEVEAN